ncbi:MAG TPA: threonine synthase [Candidatus Latescibacteria bacterium]|nr:threonine synthase [Candidatus Latescibacterota bacterium]
MILEIDIESPHTAAWPGIIQRYKRYLPVTADTPVITLLEGNTPLIPAVALPRLFGVDIELYFKFEGMNPTGSFKDRGMTLAISKAAEEGAEIVVCASTGNTSASAAAYASRAGMISTVLIPRGNIAQGKLAQAMMHGAVVIQIDGNFDDCLRLVRALAEERPVAIVNSINPYRIEGQKTGSFEICQQLGGRPPDYHALPVGNAGNITAYWKGYREFFYNGLIDRLPRMIGFQAAGSAPIVRGMRIDKPETIATAIKIGDPASWKSAVAARDESGGLIEEVTDDEITHAQKLLASYEGVFAEPASAASVAGVAKLSRKGFFPKGACVVCILTGHGLKDPERAIAIAEAPARSSANIHAVLDLLDRAVEARKRHSNP